LKRFILAASFAVLSIASFASASHASNDNVCFDNGTKVDVVGDYSSITITAPEGKLISGYCVKAGSAKQNLGPEYVEVDPAQASVTITHSSGKDISHYTVDYVDIETPPTTTVPVTTTRPVVTTTVPVTTLPCLDVHNGDERRNVCTTTTTAPTTTVVVTTTVPVEVAPAVISEAPVVLAFTGAKTAFLAGLGFALFAFGLAFTGLSRRLRTS
jgi:hypothetical protein